MLYMIRAIIPRAANTVLKLKCDNLGVVFMLMRLSTRSARVSPIIGEILWLCVVYNVVLSPSHVRSENNVLCDFGTRQQDKDFGAHVAAFMDIHHEAWFTAQMKRHPPRCARPELLAMVPRAEEQLY